MEYDENIAGLGKNHDREAKPHDLAKKQSEAKPAAENLDDQPYSVNKKEIDHSNPEDDKQIHEQAQNYAAEEHQKAEEWEDHSGSDDQDK